MVTIANLPLQFLRTLFKGSGTTPKIFAAAYMTGILPYFSYRDHYLKFEELPAGNGYADIVYFPKKNSPLPALIIELKWEKTAQAYLSY